MISVTNLAKDYRNDGTTTRALAGVSFNVAKGEFMAIMGPSGSGKSTLLHILSFLDRPSGGTYTFNGKRIEELSDEDLAHIRNREMGFVFQAFNLLGRASVYENIEMPLLYAEHIPARERTPRVHDAIRAVGLAEKTDVEAGKLSGGEKQRVAIARALVTNPNVIFADEPTGNLDSQSGAQVMAILENLNRTGRTVILVTHETYTAEFANRVIRLKDGSIVSDEMTTNHHTSTDKFFK
ncbi:MAG: macrolide ABC transporter ATP-binding protein [Candidatus Sungbacteria bacterium RIFCSPLOWO2_01_FULL_59_16]|uniref:Macrolide ABC transporter ATP-binding protein n=1 Tax=Candidatus Sungbacteria bacterium RIFCSPLOWO2_01_FULL_59_16 TaxID=1802280 RepID=A0A1G2LCY5_9BACT|nr:MAG: macrolide ABC transporter ATP-binding protein [Candidatus Sungbacteria bacterium RIFCSPLOWO2_01_FULL_59_16]